MQIQRKEGTASHYRRIETNTSPFPGIDFDFDAKLFVDQSMFPRCILAMQHEYKALCTLKKEEVKQTPWSQDRLLCLGLEKVGIYVTVRFEKILHTES